MSARSCCVTCGIRLHARLICRAVALRTAPSGWASIGPHSSKLGRGGGWTPGPAAGIAMPAPEASWRTYSLMSSSTTRPCRPLPRTCCKSTPSSRASRRVAGPAGTIFSCAGGGAGEGLSMTGCWGLCSGATVAGAREGTAERRLFFDRGQRFGHAGAGRFRLRRWDCGRLAVALDDAVDLADFDLIADLHMNLRDAAGHRRRHFQGRLVGLDFKQRLVLGHHLARRHLDRVHLDGIDVLFQCLQLDLTRHRLGILKKTNHRVTENTEKDTEQKEKQQKRVRPYFLPFCLSFLCLSLCSL